MASGGGGRRRRWRLPRGRLLAWVALAYVAFGLAGLLVTPHPPYSQAFFEARETGSSWTHPFGVDALGQDVFSRVWRGLGNTTWLAAAASFGALALGAALAGLERLAPPSAARLLRSLVAVGIAVPALFVGLLLAVFLQRGPGTLLLAIALAASPLAFRQLRALLIEQWNSGYVEASRAIGGSSWRVFRFSVWPCLRPQVVALWQLLFAVAALELSGLTYLGLGGDPNWAELGSLLRLHQRQLATQPALVVWPGLALVALLWLARQSKID